MDGDTDTEERIKLVKGDADGPPAPETEPFWPSFADHYKAAGEPAGCEIPRLVVAMGGRGFKPDAAAFHILPYFHIGAGAFGYDDDGQWFRFPFHEPMGGKLLLARGRSIMACANAISLHRLPWIRAADRDFRPAGGSVGDVPIFTKIEVTDLEEA